MPSVNPLLLFCENTFRKMEIVPGTSLFLHITFYGIHVMLLQSPADSFFLSGPDHIRQHPVNVILPSYSLFLIEIHDIAAHDTSVS